MDIFHVSFGSKIKAPTVRRWEFRGIIARRGEVDGATPFAHGEAHRLDARPTLVRSDSDDKRAPTTRGLRRQEAGRRRPRLRPFQRVCTPDYRNSAQRLRADPVSATSSTETYTD